MGSFTVSHTVSVAAILMAAALAPFASAQTPSSKAPQPAPPAPAYSAPRTSGQPSLEGVWTHNFILLMEASSPTLTLPETEAKAMAAATGKMIGDQLDHGLDPEVPELMRNTDAALPSCVASVARGRSSCPPMAACPTRPRHGRNPAAGRSRSTPTITKSVRTGSAASRVPACRLSPASARPVSIRVTSSRHPATSCSTPSMAMKPASFRSPRRTSRRNSTLLLAMPSPAGMATRWWSKQSACRTMTASVSSTLVVTPEAKVIERFTRLSANELLYQYTVEDPKSLFAAILACRIFALPHRPTHVRTRLP